MLTIQTAPNTLTTINVKGSNYNPTTTNKRWEIRYNLERTEIIKGLRTTEPDATIVILDVPEQPILNDEGVEIGVIPAVTDFSDWWLTWTTPEQLLEASINKVVELRDIVLWDGSVIDDITNDPNADVVQEWIPNEFVAPPNRRSYNDVWYDVVVPHTTSAVFPPPIATLYAISAEQPGNQLPAWSAQTYAINAEVTYLGESWINRRDNNNQQFAPGVIGSGWLQTSNTPAPWYNLGNEGYPINWTVTHNAQTWINTSEGNTFEPGVFGWNVQ